MNREERIIFFVPALVIVHGPVGHIDESWHVLVHQLMFPGVTPFAKEV